MLPPMKLISTSRFARAPSTITSCSWHVLILLTSLCLLCGVTTAAKADSTGIGSRCRTVEYALVASNRQANKILEPVIAWDLLSNPLIAKAIQDSSHATVWSWTHHSASTRRAIIRYLGGNPDKSPILFESLGILQIPVKLHSVVNNADGNSSKTPWISLACAPDSLLLDCERYLEALGCHNGSQLAPLHDAQIVPYNTPSSGGAPPAMDLTAASDVWTTARQGLVLSGYYITQRFLKLSFCVALPPAARGTPTQQMQALMASEIKAREQRINTDLGLSAMTMLGDREPFLFPMTATSNSALCSDCICFSSSSANVTTAVAAMGGADQIEDSEPRQCRICFSAEAGSATLYRVPLRGNRVPATLILVFDGTQRRYLALNSPFAIADAIGDNSQQCTIIAHSQFVATNIDSLGYNAASAIYNVALRGTARRAVDAASMGDSAVPELDGLRAAWLLLLCLILIRRLLIYDDSLVIAITWKALGDNLLRNRIAPINRGFFITDPLAIVVLFITAIWYGAAVATILPPAPTYATFYFVAVFAVFYTLATITSSLLIGADCYATWSDFLRDTIRRMAFFCGGASRMSAYYDEVPLFRAHAPKTFLITSCVQRLSGTMVALCAILYAVWWDTDDVYNWAIVALACLAICAAMTYHSVSVFLMGSLARSFITCAYAFATAAATTVFIVFAVLDVIHPLFLFANAGIYPAEAMIYVAWLAVFLINTFVVLAAYAPHTRTLRDLYQRARQTDSNGKLGNRKPE